MLNADGTPLSYVPLSVVGWQDAMRLVFLDKVRVIKEYEHWTIRSQHLEIKVPSIVIMTTQVKWTKGLKYSWGNVLLRDEFTCQLQNTWRCKEAAGKVKFADLTLDHIVPRSMGGKTNWLNVCVACKACNSDKGNNHKIVPKKMPKRPTYYEILNKRKRLPIHVRDADWAHYLDWPAELIKVSTQPGEHG